MKWARLDGEKVLETTEIDPTGRFHPSIVWTQVSDDVISDDQREIAKVRAELEKALEAAAIESAQNGA